MIDVTDKRAENSLVVIEIRPMPRKEIPGSVNFLRPVVARVAVQSVKICLEYPCALVTGRQRTQRRISIVKSRELRCSERADGFSENNGAGIATWYERSPACRRSRTCARRILS